MRNGLSWLLAAASTACACPALSQPPSAPPMPPAVDAALARDIFRELIEINTVHDHGTKAAVQALAARFRAAGFSDADVQVLTPPEHPDHPNLVVRLRGKAGGGVKPVLWIGHIDVVEARPEDWTVPPFKLTEKDGYFYGRGTSDMKDEDAIVAESLIRLKREGYAPARDIVAAFTADEESGDANGVQWLVKAHRDLVDAAMVINPDGGGPAMHGERLAYFGVQTSEKIYVTYQLEATNRGGHSSVPRPDNAIYELAEALTRVAKMPQPVLLTATTRGYFAHMAQFQTGQARADMLTLAKEPPDPAAARRISSTPEGNAQLHTTCVATLLSGGHAENALPQRAAAAIQCRMMPGETQDGVQARITAAVADPAIHVTVINAAEPSPESPPTPALMASIERVVQSMWPVTPVVPVMELGATDGLYSRGAGLPTYGVSSVGYDLDDVRAHGRDERIRMSSFDQGVEFTYRLMKEMSSTR